MQKTGFIHIEHGQAVRVSLKPLAAYIKWALAGGLLVTAITPYAAPPNLPVLNTIKLGKVSISKNSAGTALNIHQKNDKAILHWDSFNIGAKNSVAFKQPKSTSVALNKILQQDPSRILGSLSANGQVYLVNKNGFVFGKNSTVNVNTLVATALDISEDVFKKGGITKLPTGSTTAALGGDDPAVKPVENAKIDIKAGAKVNVGKNGRMILAAPKVNNAGKLSTDNYGQIMLVASEDKVYLTENTVDQSAPTRVANNYPGLLVEVGKGGEVNNEKLGDIVSRLGNVTLAGFAVNQKGRVTATTSTRVNGAIRLIAREGATANFASDGVPVEMATVRHDPLTGKKTVATVSFGPNSSTQIHADEKTDLVAVDEQKQPRSYLEASAHTVHLQGGSRIKAPGAIVDITATNNPFDPLIGKIDPVSQQTVKEGRIILDKAARIDISGAKNITVPVERNLVEVPVQSFELRNSPRQKKGVLQGQVVTVDIRDKPTIIDTSGAEKRVLRGTDERLAKLGKDQSKINLRSGGDVIVNPQAAIDISGGQVNYKPGYISTTKLVTDYGAIVDIGDADPNLHYRAVLGSYKEAHEKWGVTKAWQSGGSFGRGRFDPGYVEGLDAGVLNIITPKLAWNGVLLAGSKSGIYQRAPKDKAYGGAFNFGPEVVNKDYPSSQNVIFQKHSQGLNLAVDDLFPAHANHEDSSGAEQAAYLVLSADMLNNSGVQELSVKTKGNALIAEDASLTLTPGKTVNLNNEQGSFSNKFNLVAKDIKIDGTVYAPGGFVGLGAGYDTVLKEKPNIDGNSPVFGEITYLTAGASAKLDVSGCWVNDFALGLGAMPTTGLTIHGGQISLASAGDLDLQTGSKFQADGGAHLSQEQRLTNGKGGTLDIRTEQPADSSIDNTNLTVNGKFSAYGVENGGYLSVSVYKSGDLIIGKTGAIVEKNTHLLEITHDHLNFPGITGFGDLSLTNGSAALKVSQGATLDLKQKNLMLNSGYQLQASRDHIGDIAHLASLPDYLRKPVNLTLAGKSVQVETGAKIIGDIQAKINLKSSGDGSSVYFDGLINAPAGEINLQINNTDGANYDPSQAVWLGRHASLQAKGASILNPVDALGRQTGEVLTGGKVNLATNYGFLILEQGSSIDVSGSQAKLDIISGNSPVSPYLKTNIASDAGAISLNATEGMAVDGSLTAKPGSTVASGGKLELSLDRRNRPNINGNFFQPPTSGATVEVNQQLQPKLKSTLKPGDSLDAQELGILGHAAISSEQIHNGQFNDIHVKAGNQSNDSGEIPPLPEIKFKDTVNLTVPGSIHLEAPLLTWQGSGGNSSGVINLTSAYVKAGANFNQEVVDQSSVKGNAVLAVNSRWLDVEGFSRWDNFKRLNFKAKEDVRLGNLSSGQINADGVVLGKLLTGADIEMVAGQIYPSTLAKYTVAIDQASNPDGRITLAKSGGKQPSSPLSAAGEITFAAPYIQQNGIVKAPFGKINFNAGKSLELGAGSLTSLSGGGLLVPFGDITAAGQNWKHTNINKALLSLPEKKLTMSAPDINLKKGSTVDISGGGDLYAYQFEPGIGGGSDYLGDFTPSDGSPVNYQGGFAVLPGRGSALSPFDPKENALGNDKFEVGSQIYLNGSNKLAAGVYTLLPARYALLPGALLVTPQIGTQDQQVTTFTSAGLPVVGGYYVSAATGKREARWHGFQIEDGKDIRIHSQYNEQTANNFFTQRALTKGLTVPLLPKDSGQLVMRDVESTLALEGVVKAAPDQGGRSARIDIAANKINVVNNTGKTPGAGALQLSAKSLSNLNAGSLFLGGERSRVVDDKGFDTGITKLTVSAEEINFAKNTNLSTPELLAAAKQNVTVQAGASLQTQGSVNTGDKILNVNNAPNADGSPSGNDGALLRISSANQVGLIRTNTLKQAGSLQIDAGATLGASQSMLLDASQSTGIKGDLAMQNGSLSLNADKINLGEVEALSGTNALNFSNKQLSRLNVEELILASRNAINFYGKARLKNSRQDSFEFLALDSPVLRGIGNGNQQAEIKAKNLVLKNTQLAGVADAPSPQLQLGGLNVNVQSFQQAGGKINIDGFNAVNVNAGKDFNIAGNGKLTLSSDISVNAGYVTAASGKSLEVEAAGQHVEFGKQGESNAPALRSFAGKLAVNAASIGVNTDIVLPSGKLELHSTKGDIKFGSNAHIDLAGRNVRFGDVFDYTPGGQLTALADKGIVNLEHGSKLGLSTGGGKAEGGQLKLGAPKKYVLLAGELQNIDGSVSLDVAGFHPASSLNSALTKLNMAGINNEVSVRSRQSGLTVDAGIQVAAESIKFISDKGSVSVSGKLIADKADVGGRIALFAGDKVSFENGALVSARGLGKSAQGGKVLVSSTDSDNDGISGVFVNPGSVIDVSGSSGKGGEVVLRALRTEKNTNGIEQNVAIKPITGAVKGFSEFYAEGVKKYGNVFLGNDGAIDAADIAKLNVDTQLFMSPLTMRKVNQSLGKSIQLRPGLEIDYHGDLSLVDDWNLADWRYAEAPGKSSLPGKLTIKATGNLNLQASINDGFNTTLTTVNKQQYDEFGTPLVDEFGMPKTVSVQVSKDVLLTGDSWSYQLVAGSDLDGADSNSLGTEIKNVSFKQKANPIDPFNQDDRQLRTMVRTGSGDISLAASGDVVFGGGRLLNSLGLPVLDPTQTVNDPLTGSISLATFEYKTAVYTAGKAQAGSPYGAFSRDFIDAYYGYDQTRFSGKAFAAGEFPVEGGDLNIYAANNIKGALNQYAFQSLQEPWLVRQGGSFSYTDVNTGEQKTANVPTAWAVDFAKFSQNIGGFGGAQVKILAGKNIDDIGVALPTNGKPVGKLSFNTDQQLFTAFDNKLSVNGGGQLNVAAGDDISGGSFHLGQGEAWISAGGSIKGGHYASDTPSKFISQLKDGPLFLVGDTRLNLSAHRGIAVSSVTDATVAPMISSSSPNQALFFGYGPNSSLVAKSLSGNVVFDNNNAVLGDDGSSALGGLGNYYPASLRGTSFDGNIIVNNKALPEIKLFPASTGQLNLLAQGNIGHIQRPGDADETRLTMSDENVSDLPNSLNPVKSYNEAIIAAHAFRPVHLGDREPVRVIAQKGNIENLYFDLPKKSIIHGAKDILNSTFYIQHAESDGDSSIVNAGRDIAYPVPLDAAELQEGRNVFNLIGTGDLFVVAGRDVDLGTNNGMATLGNGPTIPFTNAESPQPANPNLAARGGKIAVLAGLAGTLPSYLDLQQMDPKILEFSENFNKYQILVRDFIRNRTGQTKLSIEDAFIEFNKLLPAQYASLEPKFEALKSNSYQDKIDQMKAIMVSFMRDYRQNPSLTETAALGIFKSLKPEESLSIQPQLNKLAGDILFSELNSVGSASAADPLAGNERGYRAIDLLFPGKNWRGDINLASSTIQTKMGGDINLLVPGGSVNVGLPAPGIVKSDNRLGVIANREGNVNVFLKQNFNVNQSRVFALGGGDISVWSSFGNIDAGRGAKTAFAVSEPNYSFDADGNFLVDFPPPVAGSGIRTAAPIENPAIEAGNVGLFAPGGVVNAGEAGIGGNNVTISATAVIGANNIDVGGVSTGVPVTSTVSLAAGLTGTSNVAANATKMAEAAASMDKERDADSQQNKRKQLGTISVELIGFGA